MYIYWHESSYCRNNCKLILMKMVGMFSVPTVACIVAALAVCLHLNLFEYFVYFDFKFNREATGIKEKLHYEIVIGVLSARENIAQRQAIRETWAGYIQNHIKLRDKLLVNFIIGSNSCNIPHELREDPYSCKSIAIDTNTVNLRGKMVAFNFKISQTKIHKGLKTFPNSEYYGIDFNINYPIVVRKLGIYDIIPLDQQRTVALYDTWSKDPIIRVNFSSDDPGILQDSFRYKNVETYLFPKNFQGTIIAGPLGQENLPPSGIRTKQNEFYTYDTSKILSVRSFQRTSKMATFPEEIGLSDCPFSAGNFIFEIHKPEEMEKMMDSRVKVEQLHSENNKKETETLNNEQQQHGDLLFVDEVDVYRNIPSKMLHFFHWVVSSTEANLIIKTDDDCFLNVDTIMEILQDGYISANSRTWWGSFRNNWPLDLLGKWAEYKYPSPVYPAFACGSGNLLTRDLVNWIALNSKMLHGYQGEDVSVGIWLASVLPTYVDDRRWACEGICHQDVFVLPEQSPQQLQEAWHNWVQCKNPCSCD